MYMNSMYSISNLMQQKKNYIYFTDVGINYFLQVVRRKRKTDSACLTSME